MFEHDDPYVRFLLGRKEKRVYIKPYVGNSGDTLIRMGTVHLLSDLGVVATVDPRKADLILWPGGNPSMWRGNVKGWQEVWARFPETEFVVGPATFQFGLFDWPRAVRESPAPITGLFARDRESFANLQKAGLPNDIEIGLSHDPALHLRRSAWLSEHKEATTEEYVLASFRSDHEAAGREHRYFRALRPFLPTRVARHLRWRLATGNRRRNIAAAAKRATAETPLRACDASGLDFASFVETVRRAKEVHTDRLHCLLLAVMLDKPAFAYPTSYGKLEAVHEHSLKGWARVTFVPMDS